MPLSSDAMPLSDVNILLVDDHAANLLALEAMLQAPSYRLVQARSGEEALARLLEADFAVVLLDVLMPGMDGFEAARCIRGREQTRHLPIIFLTAWDAEPAAYEQAYALGAVDFLRKPFSPEMLRAKVSVFVELFRKTVRVQELEHAARVRAERALTQSEERFRLIVESAQDVAILTLDHEGRVTSWNPGAERILGYGPDEILGRDGALFFTPEDIAQQVPHRERTRALANGRAANERWHVRKDGTHFFASGVMMPLKDDGGNVRGFLKIFRDRTEERKAKEALVRKTQSLALLAGNATRLLGDEQPTELIHATLRALATHLHFDVYFAFVRMADDWPFQLAACSGLADEVCKSAEFLNFGQSITDAAAHDRKPLVQEDVQGAADPHINWAHTLGLKVFACQPLFAREQVIGSLSVGSRSHQTFTSEQLELLRAVSDQLAAALARQQAEEALREANRRKDEFMAMLAHELRNPLVPIRNGLEILRRHGADPKSITTVSQMIDRQLRHLTRMVNDLLDVSRITRGKITLNQERLDLGRLVRLEGMDQRPVVEGAGLTLRLDVPDIPLWVSGDAVRLTQVFDNLLRNAVKFSNQGGTVTVRVVAETTSQTVALIVQDTGIGIESEFLPHIFETFTQADRSLDRSRGGLGLGLAVVWDLVRLHGGTVEAASAGTNRGANFTVRLPLVPEPAALTQRSMTRAPRRDGQRVLVVEDNRDAAESLRILLDLAGYEVTIASSGIEGLELAKRIRPNAVVSDIGLPGIDGYDLATALRAEPATSGCRLIAVTGYGSVEDQQRAAAAGFDEHLTKPVDPDELMARLAMTPNSASR